MLKTGMNSSKSTPEMPDEKQDSVQDDEIIQLDDSVDEVAINDELTEELVQEEKDTLDVEADPEESAQEPPARTDKQDTPPIDDPDTDRAVEEIVAEESDKILEAEDKARQEHNHNREIAEKKPSRGDNKLARFIKAVWENPKARWATISGAAVLVLALSLVPQSRYFILNTAQVRASLELKVVDAGTLQPLKNVTVKAANAEAKTGSDGMARLEKVKLGKTTLRIEKRAFAPEIKDIVIGWGSNPLGEFKVKAVGSQYTFYVKDALSGNPLPGAEATSGDGNARADEEGKIILTLDTAEMDDAAQIRVEFSAESYRKETVNITVNNREAQSVPMIPSRRHAFVSKRSGKYDVYTADADGRNERRVLGGTSYERDDLALIPHPKEDYVAYVATRENTRNQSGYLLSTLYVIDTESGDTVKVDQSEQIHVIGWSSKGRLVYVKIAAGASGEDPKRHRLISFNNEDHTDTKELASSNSFNDVVMVGDRVFYAPSNIFNQGEPGTYAVDADGENHQTILNNETFSIFRTDYDTLYLSVGSSWFEHVIGSPTAAEASAPNSTISRMYVDNPHNNTSIWVDNRDGRGVLIKYDKGSKQEEILYERGGLKMPLYWLTDKHIIFRVSDGRETADYIMNIEGGEPRKISDVTDAAGITRWLYF